MHQDIPITDALIQAQLIVVTTLRDQPDQALEVILVPWESAAFQPLYALGIYLASGITQYLFLDIQGDLGRFHLTDRPAPMRLVRLKRHFSGEYRQDRSVRRVPSSELFQHFAPSLVADGFDQFIRRYVGQLNLEQRQRLRHYAGLIRMANSQSIDRPVSDTYPR